MNLYYLVLLQSRGYYDVMDQMHDDSPGSSYRELDFSGFLVCIGALILLGVYGYVFAVIKKKREAKEK